MERKFLEDLGIASDLVDKIISEHGKDINTIKAQRDTYKTQLDTTKAELKKFDGVNVEDLRGQITKLQTSNLIPPLKVPSKPPAGVMQKRSRR